MTPPIAVFTSGCFDAGLHAGHLFLFDEMRKLGDFIIVGLNSDDYIRRKKHRQPVYDQETRRRHLYEKALVDRVAIFDEDGPLKLILRFKPDFIVVGGDYTLDKVVGAKEAEAWGGKTVIVPRLPGLSTTEVLAARANLT